MARDFTQDDFFTAAKTRFQDVNHLFKKEECIIFSVYCCGVAIECMLRAYMKRNAVLYNPDHNLRQLYETSNMTTNFSDDDKIELIPKLTASISTLFKHWNNDLRYVSEKRLKRKLFEIHNKEIRECKSVHKFLKKRYKDVFNATKTFINIGESKWV